MISLMHELKACSDMSVTRIVIASIRRMKYEAHSAQLHTLIIILCKGNEIHKNKDQINYRQPPHNLKLFEKLPCYVKNRSNIFKQNSCRNI